jgi:ribose/xylose/arabinose/galactoside ABC-type transport system permease subunit
MIPFVVTLSMMAVTTGTSTWLTSQVSITGIDLRFIDTVMARIWIIPAPVIFLFCMTAIIMILVRKSMYGRWLYAVGTNIKTAQVSGIPKDRVIFGTYLLSGFFTEFSNDAIL